MSKPNDVPVKPGDILDGKYRVERVLGSGGMGIVVQARHVDLEKRVAIKLMLPEALRDPESVARFQREARAAVRLHSEHTARVLDVGRMAGGAPYMVMEFLVGKDLGQIVEESGAIPLAHAVDFIVQACEAIAEAHALGIVHRDVKPRNLFLTHRVDGRPLVKVLDFGLAKTLDQQNDHALTRTTAVMGSPQYMSPEQMRASREVDHRTDIWSLGVCLYEMVTGTVPFEAATVPMLCAMVLKEAPRPPSDVRPDLPLDLSAIILRCLEKEPTKRFADVAELAEALEQFGAPSSHGSAGRVRHVLSSTAVMAIEMESPARVSSSEMSQSVTVAQSETRTAASFDSRPRRESSRGGLIAIGAGLVAVCVALVAVILVLLNHRAHLRKDPPAAASTFAQTPPLPTDPLPDPSASTPSIALPPPTTAPPPPPTPPPLVAQTPTPPPLPGARTVPTGTRKPPPPPPLVRPPTPPPPSPGATTAPPPPPMPPPPKKDPGSTF